MRDMAKVVAGEEGRLAMLYRTGHGREPEPREELLDCLAYVQAVHAGQDETALAAFDVVRGRLAGRRDAMVAPLILASLILDEAAKQGCDADSVLAAVRGQAYTLGSPGAGSGARAAGDLSGGDLDDPAPGDPA
jgi:hypothetical protein